MVVSFAGEWASGMLREVGSFIQMGHFVNEVYHTVKFIPSAYVLYFHEKLFKMEDKVVIKKLSYTSTKVNIYVY